MSESSETTPRERSSSSTRRKGTIQPPSQFRLFKRNGQIFQTLSKLNCLLTLPRQALRYIIRNTTLPPRMRAQAQLELSQMHAYTRPTQIRNRCIDGGKGRGVFRDFNMARVSLRVSTIPATWKQLLNRDAHAVLLSNERASGQPTWSQESQLVIRLFEVQLSYGSVVELSSRLKAWRTAFLRCYCILGDM